MAWLRVWALASFTFVVGLPSATSADDQLWVRYPGQDGPGKGKKIVLISGDEEYRSEEALPQLGKILAKHHGFDCTVLFAVNPKDGTINPNQSDNIPGMESVPSADLVILGLRFRNLPDEQMKHFVAHVEAGKPIIGLRTSTHAFNTQSTSKFADYNWTSKKWDGGFGRQVLGETWISHHGGHGSQSTRGLVVPGSESHPILRGIADGDIWGPTDVYGVRLPLPDDAKPLVLGQILEGMSPNDKPLKGSKNEPMMPVAWTKSYQTPTGKKGQAFCTTMGASQDLESEGLRRLLVNATYWLLGMEQQIPSKTHVDIVGKFRPLPFKFNGFQKGVKPSDHAKME